MNLVSQVLNSSGNSYQVNQGHGLSKSGAKSEAVQKAELEVHRTQVAASEAGVKLFPAPKELARPRFRNNTEAKSEDVRQAELEVHTTQIEARRLGVDLVPTPNKLAYSSFTGQFKHGQD